MSGIFAVPTIPKLKSVYDGFTPGATVMLGSSALISNLQFSDRQMLRCHDSGFVAGTGNCNWGRLGAETPRETPLFSSVGFSRNTSGFSAGFERRIGAGSTSVGAAIRYSRDALFDSGAATSLSGNGLEAGLSATRMLTMACPLGRPHRRRGTV